MPSMPPRTLPACPHVLVVDDYDYVFRVIARMLRRVGYTVTATKSATEALDVIARRSPPVDLLLTDVRMPDVSGPELAEAARKVDPALPLLFMSGFMDYDADSAPFGARLLNKPFTMEVLLDAIVAEVGRPGGGSSVV